MHELLAKSTLSPISLYIHIPFCSKKCPYCAFYKETHDSKLESNFITALCNEIESYKIYNLSLKSIFFGGGTPSLLSTASFKRIFATLNSTFIIPLKTECTIECNPENISRRKLDLFHSLSINRLSIGIQSFNQDELTFLGRTHTPEQLHDALKLVQESHFTNFNLDLIYALPISTLSHLKHSLLQSLSYEPTHISTYCLSIENGTQFEKKNILPLHSDLEANHYLHIKDILTKQKYLHYEISAFCKKNYSCTHNLSYWNFDSYLSVGPSAHSFIFPYRFSNTYNLQHYINDPRPIWQQKKIKKISLKDLTLEYFCSTLRLKKGFNTNHYKSLFKTNIPKSSKEKMIKLIQQNLLKQSSQQIYCTEKGFLLLNDILLNLTE